MRVAVNRIDAKKIRRKCMMRRDFAACRRDIRCSIFRERGSMRRKKHHRAARAD